MSIKTVFLDAGGTLFRPYPSVGEIYADTAERHGLRVTPQDIERMFGEAWHARNGLSALTGATTDKIERDWWYGLVRDVFAPLGTFADFEAFFTDLYDRFARAECWRLFDDVLPTLTGLREKGIQLGILSNWDHRLFLIVESLGLVRYFSSITASSAAGIAKPGEGIFRKALESLGARASESIHVGDSLVDDYHGAVRAGIRGILLERSGKPYNGVVTIRSLLDVFAHLS